MRTALSFAASFAVWLAASTAAAASSPALHAGTAAAALAQRSRPAVVKVEGLDPMAPERTTSGVLVGSHGLVLTWSAFPITSGHVIVAFSDGTMTRGRVLDRDSKCGVVALSIGASRSKGLEVAGAELTAGAPVLTVGYAFATQRADGGPATGLGIVAQVKRTGRPPKARTYILSDAVNPGDFGGALVDRDGRLAGILLRRKDSASGLSTAEPIQAVARSFKSVKALAAALSPSPGAKKMAGSRDPWPVHDSLRKAADDVAPAVASLVAFPDSTDGHARIGSCVIIDAHGYALTTMANVSGSTELLALLPDGRRLHSKILGTDERLGIAVVRIEGANLPAAPVAEKAPAVGSFVVAVGNPDGPHQVDGPLLSVGIVGARNRGERHYDALHTDAAVDGSNAGGALVDLEGRVVGILSTLGGTALSDFGRNSGVGFAIPTSAILKLLPLLKKGTKIAYRPGYLGVRLSFDMVAGGGVKIDEVVKGKPAAAAGLETGDVIVGADGVSIGGIDELRQVFSGFEQGQKVDLKVRRGGKRMDIHVVLGPWPKSIPR